MLMIDRIQGELDKRASKYKDNVSIVERIVEVLDTKLPYTCKLQLSSYFITFLASQFREPILLNGNKITINSIAFLFSQSGTGKDTTINKLMDLIRPSLDLILDRRDEMNADRAFQLLQDSGNEKKTVKDFLVDLPDIYLGVSTDEGLVQALEDNNKIPLGSISVNTNEFISDYEVKSQYVNPLLTTISEIYDVGNKQQKKIKSKEFEVKGLKGVFLSGLFTSSFNVYGNTDIRTRLLKEFSSRLARRSSITFNIHRAKEEEINDLEQWLYEEKSKSRNVSKDSAIISQELTQVTTNRLVRQSNVCINLSEEALDYYLLYKLYCEKRANEYNEVTNPITKLNIQNRFFQALKLSGALAITEGYQEIPESCMVKATQIIEIINEEVSLFERELNKQNYEVLIDYCRDLFNSKEGIVTYHTLSKVGFVRETQSIETALGNMIKLCNSADNEGIYYIDSKNNQLVYSPLHNGELYGISYIDCKGANKADRLKYLSTPLKYISVEFRRLLGLLNGDFIYSPFEFKDGIRNKDNLINTTNLIVFDVDDANISYKELHEVLKDSVNHIIATTSDKNNIYKYRVVIPLNHRVSIQPKYWNKVLRMVSSDFLLDTKFDNLSQVQIYYSYKDSEILYTDDKDYLDIKNYILTAMQEIPKPKSPKEKEKMLNNNRDTFWYAYESSSGNRNLMMIRALNHAYDLGASAEQAVDLLHDINNYIEEPLSEEELVNNIYPHLNKKWRT